MKYEDAMAISDEYYEISEPSVDDDFAFTEALGELIRESGHPKYMAELAWFYCSRKRFDLEEKYLLMAAECGYGPAFEELGYMYYFGQNGEKDFSKAFVYYTKGAQPDEYGNEGSLWCVYKLADMYRFGCYVAKDEGRYREMIEEAYGKVKNARSLGEPFPEIAYRLAGIRAEQGREQEALALLRKAKRFLAERLSYDPFWGYIEVMGRIVLLMHRLAPSGGVKADFYDLFFLTQRPGSYALTRMGQPLVLSVTQDSEGLAIEFGGRYYRDFADLCGKASVDGRRVTEIYDEFTISV